MKLEERFRYIMKLHNLSASALADEIGVQRSSISHILSGRNKPSLEFIQKILTRFPKVDAAWLINGTTQVEDEKIKPESIAVDQTTNPLESTSNVNELGSSEETKRKYLQNDLSKSKIKRIVVFYEDQSFEEFDPRTYL